jgi:hypothetical protein
MSLLQKLMTDPQRMNPPTLETKGERLEVVLSNLIETLPLPAQFLAKNYITSYQLYNDEMAEKTAAVLLELHDYICEGKIPSGQE